MEYFPAKSAVCQPTGKGGDTKWRRIVAKSVSDGWSPETLHGAVSMMAVTLLSFKGHFCPSCTPNRETITSSDTKIAWFNLTPCTWDEWLCGTTLHGPRAPP